MPERPSRLERLCCTTPNRYRNKRGDDASRGVEVDHTTIYRWVQTYGPELDKRCRPQLLKTNDEGRVDETYLEVNGESKYLYRAVDSLGNKIRLNVER